MFPCQLTTLPNGVRILTEPIANLRSAALGIWVGTGSRHETAAQSGAAHFIEHMLFKGTQTNSAAQLAARMDAIGGQLNAFTTKECTCFYVHALDSHLMEGLDILTDMFFHSKFDQSDVETERGVVLEEIGMYRDDPSDVCAERLAAAVYAGSPLSRPILGKKATLDKMTGQWLREYKESHYTPDRIVVSLAGSYSQAVVDAITERFSALPPAKAHSPKPGRYTPAVTLKRKATEQNQLLLAFPSLPANHPKRYALQLLSSILGGGMSSRLFQTVREKQGLCYNIYTYGASYDDIGIFCVGTAQSRDTEEQAIASIRQVIDEFRQNGAAAEELERARELSKANVIMSLESTVAHMNHMGRSLLLDGAIPSAEEIIAAYDAVTLEDLKTLAEEIFRWDTASLSIVGKVGEQARYRELIR